MALLFVALGTQASAHDLGVARLIVEPRSHGIRIEAKLPAKFETTPPRVPERCDLAERTTGSPRPGVRSEHWRYECNGAALGAADRVVLPWTLDGAFVRMQHADRLGSGTFVAVDGGRFEVNLAPDGSAPPHQIVTRYVRLGIEHILQGWDHLVFLVAIYLIAVPGTLARLVTAFTLGHSVTLALAAFGWVTISTPPVEACIALSIVFVAREAIRPAGSSRHGVGLVFAFGLLHGLGFATALAQSGIARGELLFGLLGFNVGVEIGQLLFVLVVALLAAGFRQHRAQGWLEPALAFGLGSMGVFWTFERIAGFARWPGP